MAQIDKDQLIGQMESVAHNLESCGDTEDLARIIRTWVVCVESLPEEEPEAYCEMVSTIKNAMREATGYKPLDPS